MDNFCLNMNGLNEYSGAETAFGAACLVPWQLSNPPHYGHSCSTLAKHSCFLPDMLAKLGLNEYSGAETTFGAAGLVPWQLSNPPYYGHSCGILA